MQSASRRYLIWSAALLAVAALLGWGAYDYRGAITANSTIEQLKTASTGDVPGILERVGRYRRWSLPRLREALTTASAGSREELRISLALLPHQSDLAEKLVEMAMTADPDTLLLLRDALKPHGAFISSRLAKLIEDTEGTSAATRLNAAMLAASLQPFSSDDNGRVLPDRAGLANELITRINKNRPYYGALVELSQPLGPSLATSLDDAMFDDEVPDDRRAAAASLLTDLLEGSPTALVTHMADASLEHFQLALPSIDISSQQVLETLRGLSRLEYEPDSSKDEVRRVARRKATEKVSFPVATAGINVAPC